MGSEATLALSEGLGETSGDRRTRMGHTYPLPGSMAPQGALCPKLTRLTGGCPFGCNYIHSHGENKILLFYFPRELIAFPKKKFSFNFRLHCLPHPFLLPSPLVRLRIRMLNKSMVLGIVLGLGLGLGLGLAAWKTPVWTIGWRVRSTLQGVSSMAPTAVIALQPHTRGRDRGIENNSNDAEEGLWTHHHPPVRQLGVSRRALVMIDMSVDQWAGVPAVVENTPFDHSKAATLSVVQALLANTTTTFDLIVVRISLVLTRPPSPPPLPPRPAFTESFTFQISMARSLALNVDGHPPLPPLRACLLFLSGRGITSCVMCAQDTRLLLDCGGTPMYNNRTPGPRTKSGSLLCNQWHKAARLHTAANYPGAALIPELRRVETAGNVTFVAKQEHSSFVRSTLDAQLRANGTRDLGENSPVGIGGHRWAWTRLSTSTPCPCRSHSVLHRHHRQSLSALARQPQALLHHRGRTGSDAGSDENNAVLLCLSIAWCDCRHRRGLLGRDQHRRLHHEDSARCVGAGVPGRGCGRRLHQRRRRVLGSPQGHESAVPVLELRRR